MNRVLHILIFLLLTTFSIFAHIPRSSSFSSIGVDPCSSVVNHSHAGDGTRLASQTIESGTTNLTLYVIDHADPLRRPIAELDETGNLIRSFIWGNGLIAQVKADGTTHYVHADGQGSTLALTDTNNVATDQWFYSPYGEELASTGTTDIPYRWVGGHGVRKASEDLYFMRHRTYHAGVKRFLSLDPSGLNGGVNHYWYGDNNPLFFIDPFGLDSGSSSNPSFQNPSSGYLTAAQWQDNSDFRSARAVGTSGLLLGSSLSGYSDAGATIAFNNAAALLSAPGEEIIAGALFTGVARILGKAPNKSADVFRQGTLADEVVGWEGNFVKGRQWSGENPLTTTDYAKKYGLPAENTGKPDWLVGGKTTGPYKTRSAPASHNNPANTGGGLEIIPETPNDTLLDWFHMPD